MNHRQSTDIPMAEQALRTVSLAQAIEQADTAQALVSAVERADALHQAVAQARQRGVPRPGLADVVLARAQAIVERARARDAVVAALQTPPFTPAAATPWPRGQQAILQPAFPAITISISPSKLKRRALKFRLILSSVFPMK